MGVVQNIIGIARGINDRKKASRVEDVLQQNYLNNPDMVLPELLKVSAPAALAYEDDQMKRTTAATAAQEAARKARAERLGGAMKLFRGLPEGADVGAMLPQLTPLLQQQGLDETDIGALGELAASGLDLRALDDDTWKAITEDRYTTKVGTPGSHFVRDGKSVHQVPFARRAVTTRAGNSSSTDVFDPNTGEFVTGEEGEVTVDPGTGEVEGELIESAQPVAGMSAQELLPHFVAQESNDDYTAVNKDTGALGRYQVMPDTGRNLAKRLGLGWRPDMMKKDDPASQRYQDAIGTAAIQEAVDAGGGDLATTFAYYYGGSDRSKWGPKTRQYTAEMMERVGGGAPLGDVNAQQTNRSRHNISVTAPGKSYRAATPAEIAAAGYRTGTAAQVDQDGKFVNIKVPPAPKAASAKAQKDEKNKLDGKGQVSTTLADLGAAYVKLDEESGIVDTENTALQNIGARFGSSDIGQFLGGAVGTEAQSLRKRINNTRPLLIQQIRQATGMSAKAMDSNVELKFYLQAATDTTGDIISNLAAIKVLDSLYGSGSAMENLPPELLQRVNDQTKLLRQKAPTQGGVPEGTIIRNGERRKIRRGGKWEDLK